MTLLSAEIYGAAPDGIPTKDVAREDFGTEEEDWFSGSVPLGTIGRMA